MLYAICNEKAVCLAAKALNASLFGCLDLGAALVTGSRHY